MYETVKLIESYIYCAKYNLSYEQPFQSKITCDHVWLVFNINVRVCVCVCVCMHARVRVCMSMHTYTCACVCVCMCVCVLNI